MLNGFYLYRKGGWSDYLFGTLCLLAAVLDAVTRSRLRAASRLRRLIVRLRRFGPS